VTAGQEIMLISSTGTLVRTPVDEISVVGRNTQGVRLIRLGEGERLVGIERIDETLEGAAAGEAPGGGVSEPVPGETAARAVRRHAAGTCAVVRASMSDGPGFSWPIASSRGGKQPIPDLARCEISAPKRRPSC
jgi:hypothetical protein